MSKKNFSRFYSMFLKYFKCHTILVLTKKSDLDIRSDSKMKCIEDITRWREDMNFIFERPNNILRTSAASK